MFLSLVRLANQIYGTVEPNTYSIGFFKDYIIIFYNIPETTVKMHWYIDVLLQKYGYHLVAR